MEFRSVSLPILFLASGLASAQVNTASLEGIVSDPSSAPLPNAQVTVKNLLTEVTLRLTTNESGAYLARGLLAGNYAVMMEARGFKTAVLGEITLQVGDQHRQDFTLDLGAVSETLSVDATAPLLQTVNATLGVVIDSRKVLDLPVISRNPMMLVRLAPGVSAWGVGAIGGAGRGGLFGYYVDGVPQGGRAAKDVRSLSSIDYPHKLTVSFLYESPSVGESAGWRRRRGGT